MPFATGITGGTDFPICLAVALLPAYFGKLEMFAVEFVNLELFMATYAPLEFVEIELFENLEAFAAIDLFDETEELENLEAFAFEDAFAKTVALAEAVEFANEVALVATD